MKTIVFTFFCFFLLLSCQTDSEDNYTSTELKKSTLGSTKDECTKMVTVPFKADFIGAYQQVDQSTSRCFGTDYPYYVNVEFVGTGTHLGKFTGYFDFCAGGPDDPAIEGEDFMFEPTISEMVAANGDILYVSCWGSVVRGRTEDHPEHVVSYWRGPFEILGGTGRFEDATGSGMTDDYNSSLDRAHSFHHWKGTITMKKGKD